MFSFFKLFSRQDTPKVPQASHNPKTPELPHLDSHLYPFCFQSLPQPVSYEYRHQQLQSFASAYAVVLLVCQIQEQEAQTATRIVSRLSDVSSVADISVVADKVSKASDLGGVSGTETANEVSDSKDIIGVMIQDFSQQLQQNRTYQDWINFTVFGGYVQRSFRAFYRQSEDVFNADMPDLLRHELMRHTQRLPTNQVLLFPGQMPSSVRQEKLLITTLNPVHAVATASTTMPRDLAQHGFSLKKSQQAEQSRQGNAQQQPVIINIITTVSNQVKAFAVKHNKRTRERLRNEVMILDFNHLILAKEE